MVYEFLLTILRKRLLHEDFVNTTFYWRESFRTFYRILSCPTCLDIVFRKKSSYNLEQKIVEKFTKLSKTCFYVECFTADLLQFFSTNVNIYLLGCRLGTRDQILAFQGFS